MAQRLTSAEVKGLFEKLSNWGKWGKDDERGALNFITDAKRAAAAALVKTGETVSMSLPLATLTSNDNPTPVTHLMMQAGTDSPRQSMAGVADYFAISPHGFATTHLDALCHIFWQGKMYNGFDAAEVGSHGAKKCSIEVASGGVVSRGVLLDIAKVKGVEWFEPGHHIFPEDLEAAEKDHGVRVEEGDVLMVRTGRPKRRAAKGGWEAPTRGLIDMAGLDATCLPWIHERRIAILGCDGTSDVIPSGYDDIGLPIHIGTLVVMGIHLIDNADLEALSRQCARAGRYAFQFVMAPLLLKRGTASPVNPLAVF
ncbi:MAG TPA: cyclase family protein [Candidatus Binataceae bacterium]|jgi:kynurenine formamidase